MKKNICNVLVGLMLVITLTQCKKTSVNGEFQSDNSKMELVVLRQQTMKEVLSMARNQVFKEFVLSECLKQKHGDYNVYIKDIITNFKGNPDYEKGITTLEKLVSQIKAISDNREPNVFYPKAENIDRERRLSSVAQTQTNFLEEPVGVFQDVYNPDYSSPGYIVNIDNNLVFYDNITEEYAWDNDVWVIGEEENVSPENMIAAPEDLLSARTQGGAEYGGIIQCTDLNAIEHWTSGKLEFKIFILNSSGGQISVRAFGKWARKNFRDQKWKDFGHFVGNWNTSTFGNWMYENWIEEDGGSSSSITITMPPPTGQSGPTISTTFPSKNQDDNLGLATIQFTDNITQVYNISYSNIKRRN